jgi:predicted SprT family Zn-dependent metalloprotease
MNILQVNDFITECIDEYWEALDFRHVGIGNKPRYDLVNKDSGTAGFAYYKGHVEFNLPFFCTHHDIEDLKETVAHELCHIVQFRIAKWAKQHHGPEFKYYMQSIGFAGSTYHTMSRKKAKQSIKDIARQLAEVEI